MWEAIESNRRRSRVLIALLGVLLVTLGALIGATVGAAVGPGMPAYDPPYRYRHTWGPRAAPPPERGAVATLAADPGARAGAGWGALAAGAIWLLLWGLAVGRGESVLLSAANARRIEKSDAPQLWNVVEEMTIAAGLPKMPAVYIIDDAALNAFAVGYRPERAAVAVTSGLLKRLDRDELQGVIAHEIGHIRNADTRFMTLAAVMVGTIALLAELFLRGLRHVGRGRRSSSRGGGQAAAILLLVTIVFALLAPLAAQLLYFACSRRREYLADASAARFTRYPAALASALEKIERQAQPAEMYKALAPLFIVNPLSGGLTGLWSTHPPTRERIRILRSMGDAGFAAYEQAYRQTTGRRGCVGARTLAAADTAPLREPTPSAAAEAGRRARQVGELLDRVGNFVVIGCPCGVRLKLPPGDTRAQVTCPRCGRTHAVPAAEAPAVPATAVAPKRKTPPVMRYRRRGGGWESFKCGCGNPLQIGPAFSASALRCSKCGGRIEVIPPGAA